MKTLLCVLFAAGLLPLCGNAAPEAERLSIVVMDPLSKELACDCVKR